MDIQGNRKLALVTGAAKRLGKAFAIQLAKEGFDIILHYHSSATSAEETANEIRKYGVKVYPRRADLCDTSQIRELFRILDSEERDLDVLINSASIMMKGDIKTVSVDEFNSIVAINIRAPLVCSQEASKRMSKGGSIINISDIGARKSWKEYPVYSPSKAAVESMTRIFAKAVAPDIRVNAIAPGLVLPPETGETGLWEKIINRLPAKRIASTEEITSVLSFLVNNTYITGQIITVDGGYSLI